MGHHVHCTAGQSHAHWYPLSCVTFHRFVQVHIHAAPQTLMLRGLAGLLFCWGISIKKKKAGEAVATPVDRIWCSEGCWEGVLRSFFTLFSLLQVTLTPSTPSERPFFQSTVSLLHQGQQQRVWRIYVWAWPVNVDETGHQAYRANIKDLTNKFKK